MKCGSYRNYLALEVVNILLIYLRFEFLYKFLLKFPLRVLFNSLFNKFDICAWIKRIGGNNWFYSLSNENINLIKTLE